MARFTLGLLFAIRLLTPSPAAAHGLPASVEETEQATAIEEADAPERAESESPAAVVVAAAMDVPSMIADAARRWGVDASRLLRVAWCESKYNPLATSRYGHRGVFQFDNATWRERAPLAGLSADFGVAYDARANIEVAASTFAAGQWWRWSCR
jgi:soluble lytic murein transglycosylase-like protein